MMKRIFAICAAVLMTAGCTSAPAEPEKIPAPPAENQDVARAKQRFGQELKETSAVRSKPATQRKGFTWERNSVKKRERLTDTSKAVLLNDKSGKNEVFFWRDGERRSEKLNEKQRNKF